MATVTDVEVANASFPTVRQDLNDILEAIATNFSADAEPTTTYANQWWYETDTNKLYIRNEANDAWIHVLTLDQTTDVVSSVEGVSADKIEEGNSSVEVIDTGTGYIQINVDGVETARFDASGNLLVSKTSVSYTTVGHEFKTDGRAFHTADGGKALSLVRKTSDGAIVDFYKDSTEVGSIGVHGGTKLYVGSGAAGLRFTDGGTDLINPYNTSTNADADGTVNLGYDGGRFKDLYLSGGVYLGGTGNANYLHDYEEGTFTATFADAASGGTTTTTSSLAEYVKVGNTVTIYIHISAMDTTGMNSSSDIFLQGMPFVSANAQWGSVRLSGITFSGFVTAQISSNYLRLRENLSGSSNFIPVSDVTDDDGQIYVTMTYIV